MQLDRLEKIIPIDTLKGIQKLNILIVGVGGVGGYALESLARFGINNITIIDNDTIDITNLNRQLISLNSNVGKLKVKEYEKRIKDINPDINLKALDIFLDKTNIESVFKTKYDYVIDACDTITTKIDLIEMCQENNIKYISSMGTGNRIDATKLEIVKLSQTYNDPLAKVIRNIIKDRNLKDNFPVVWSSELPIKIGSRTPGSCNLVPSVAGIYCANYIINDYIKNTSNLS